MRALSGRSPPVRFFFPNGSLRPLWAGARPLSSTLCDVRVRCASTAKLNLEGRMRGGGGSGRWWRGSKSEKGWRGPRGGERGIEQNWAVTGGSTVNAASKTTQSPASSGLVLNRSLYSRDKGGVVECAICYFYTSWRHHGSSSLRANGSMRKKAKPAPVAGDLLAHRYDPLATSCAVAQLACCMLY